MNKEIIFVMSDKKEVAIDKKDIIESRFDKFFDMISREKRKKIPITKFQLIIKYTKNLKGNNLFDKINFNKIEKIIRFAYDEQQEWILPKKREVVIEASEEQKRIRIWIKKSDT